MNRVRTWTLSITMGVLTVAAVTAGRQDAPSPPDTVAANAADTDKSDSDTSDTDPSITRLLSTPQTAIFRAPRQWQPAAPDPLAARLESLEKRASRRAYLGAPPVMPHSRNYAKTKTCLDCHAEGIRIGTKYGPRMSHPVLASCQQCHVEGKNLDFAQGEDAVEPVFTGPREPQGGARAWTGAPPVIPHNLLMRTDCLSCHGPGSYAGLQTSHPERLNCVQCHGVAATLDQTSPFFSGNASGVVPVLVPIVAPVVAPVEGSPDRAAQ